MILQNFFPIISLLLFTTNLFFPQVGFIVTFFIPLLVITYLTGKTRNKKSDIYSIVALLIALFYKPIVGVSFILIVLAPSFFLYFNTVKEKKIYPVITSGLPAFLVTLASLSLIPEYRELLQEAIINNINMVANQMSQNDIPLEDKGYIAYISNNKESIAEFMVMLLPCLSYSYVALLTYISRSFAYRIKNIPVKLFKVPDVLIIPFIIGGFFIIGSSPISKIIAYNTLIIFGSLFFFQGLDLVNFFMIKFNVFVFLRLLFYIVIFSEPFMLIFVALFGLFDNWFHFDKITFKKDNN
jgi:uncharacterized protein YybS (DUF2232 family)